jgi:hypothetical protein
MIYVEVNINLACRPKPISPIPAWVLGLDHSCNGFCFLFNEMVYSAKKVKNKRWGMLIDINLVN